MIIGILALDIRLGTYRRAEDPRLVPALAYLQRVAPPVGSVVLLGGWYPTARYFFEYGLFRGSPIYPDSFRFETWADLTPLVTPETQFLIGDLPEASVAGTRFVRDPGLPAHLFRLATPTPARSETSGEPPL